MNIVTTSFPEEVYLCNGKETYIKFCEKSKKVIIQHGNNNSLCLPMRNKTMKMLQLFLRNKGVICSYLDIAKAICCNCYREGVDNGDVVYGVRSVRKDLVDIFKKAGVPVRLIKKMIVPVENTGYKFVQG